MQDLLRDTAAPDRLIVDAPPLDQTVPPAAKLLYRVSFEKGTTAAEVGISKVATMSTGAVTVAPNPKKDARNSSNLVGRHSVGVGYNRAELSSQRLPTVNKLYSYRWSYYLPKDFFTQISGWMAISQWKTWPCGDHDGYATQICGSCGIFNEIRAGSTGLEVRFRAEPSCLNVKPSMATDSWVTFVLEIFWSNSNNGHARLWRNDQLVFDQKNFKTLFDNFKPGTCDVFWAVGLYSSNTKPLQLFTDNIEIWEGKIK